MACILCYLVFSIVYQVRAKQSFFDRCFAPSKNAGQDILAGVVIIVSLFALMFWVERHFGLISVEGWHWDKLSTSIWLRAVLLAFASSFTAGFTEEIIFRGYLQSRLESVLTRKTAIVIAAGIFSLVHLPVSNALNDHVYILLFNICLIGIVFSYLFYRTQSLWLLISLHFMYDFSEDLFNLSAIPARPSSFGAITHPQASSLLIGNEYGSEPGILCTVMILLIFFIAHSYVSKVYPLSPQKVEN